jgi:DNA polymerase alpha subunit B
MADSVDAEIKELFSPSGKELEADVVFELKSIMRLHSIPPQELFYKWESYSIKLGSDDLKLDIETVRGLKRDIQDGLERESKSRIHVRSADKRATGQSRNITGSNDVFGMYVQSQSLRRYVN